MKLEVDWSEREVLEEGEGVQYNLLTLVYLSKESGTCIEAWMSASAAARKDASMNTRDTGSLQLPSTLGLVVI